MTNMPTHAQRLIHAVRTQNHDRLLKLIEEHDEISARSAAGRTALHAAAEEGDLEAARILIDAGADINAAMHTGETPLHLAAAYGGFCDLSDPDIDRRDPCNRRRHRPLNMEMANVLTEIIKQREPDLLPDLGPLDKIPEEIKPDAFFAVLECFSHPDQLYQEIASRGIDVDRVDPYLAEQLRGNPRYLRVVEMLLDRGANIHALAATGAPVLRGATELGTAQMVKLLLKRGADPNKPISHGETLQCLIGLALERSKIDVAEALLNHGATFDPNAFWFLHEAAANGRLKVVLWLLDHGADINRCNDRGDSALLAAARSGHDDVVASLIARGADVRVHNSQGDAALHAAAFCKSCLEPLLQLGLPIDEPNGRGRTALHLAAQCADVASMQALLQAGASINAQDHAGSTPLHIIFDSEEFRPDVEFPVFHALVSAGADRSIKNQMGKTAFDLATEWSYPEEYLKLLDPAACADPASFIWLGQEPYADFLPKAMVRFEIGGTVWPSSEHYFHAQKTTDPDIRERVRQASTIAGAVCLLRESEAKPSDRWPQQCDEVMRFALLTKFRQHDQLRQNLLATGNATLISDSNCDSYWMERQGAPFNAIGKMLMDIRAQLNAEAQGK